MKRKDWNPRTSTERRFFERINRLTRQVRRICNTYNSVAEITAAISAITEMQEWQTIAHSEALKMVRSVVTQNASNWREAARKAGGRKSYQIFQALNQELSNHEKYKAIILRNAELIRNLPNDVARKITEHVSTQAVRGLRADALLEDIREFAPHVSETRARLIARTEVAKTNAAITEIHAQQAGINFYIWQTSQDARVRSSHKHMQGVVCSFNSPPSPEQLNGEPPIGYYNPGQVFNCRCFASPIINPDFENWPKKVVQNGRLVQMSKAQFEAMQ